MSFSHELIANRQIKWAKLLRDRIFEKIAIYKSAKDPVSVDLITIPVCKSSLLLQFHHDILAQQMTILDMNLFQKIEIAEMLSFAKTQDDEAAPNLKVFTEHFNKMSFWVRTQILRQTKNKNREKYLEKFISIMESLLGYSNFNSYFSLFAALQSPVISR